MTETLNNSLPNHTLDDKPFWGLGEVLKLAWPASLSMLNGTIMMFVDGLMVARTGPDALAGQFMGGIVAFIPCSLGIGLLNVVNTFVSQNVGAGRRKRCGQYAWAGIVLAVGMAILAQPLLLVAGKIFSAIGHDPNVQAIEILYFRYMILGLGLALVSRVLEQFFYGIGRPNIVLATSLVANVVNIAANYVLIFGKLGLPAMGVAGAAIGTLLGAAVLVLLLGAVFLSQSMHRQFATRLAGRMKFYECGEILRIGWSSGVQFCNSIFSWSLFTAFMIGRFGTTHISATTTAVRYMSISFMPAVGIGIAATALVGRYIGKSRLDLARKRAHAACLVAMAYMGFCAVCFFIWRYPLMEFYISSKGVNIDPAKAAEIVEIGATLLMFAVVFQLFDAIVIVFIGALRGAGDTFVPMIFTIVLIWAVLVGGSFAMVCFFPELKSYGPWIAATANAVILSILMVWRFESGKWKKIDLLRITPPPPDTPVDSGMEM